MLLVINGEDTNERKLDGLKHLFTYLVTFGRHIITVHCQVCEPSQAHVLHALMAVVSFFLPLEKVQIFRDFTYNFFMVSLHKNPPSFDTLLLYISLIS
jgi:hypothetical protein